MDETTPHIHATVVPIVRGERRKAVQQQAQNNGKRTYRKKNPNTARLCADDVMSRPKLKEYQTTYAERMAGYGLQRGIEGSEAKHITGSQFYKEVFLQQGAIAEKVENLREQQTELSTNIETLQAQQTEAQADYRTIDEQRKRKQQELQAAEKSLEQTRRSIKTDKLKGAAVDTTIKAVERIGSLFHDSKQKKAQHEIENLKQENTTLKKEVSALKSTAEQITDEAGKVVQGLRSEIAHLHDLMPELKGLLQVEKICKAVRFGAELTKRIVRGESVGFKGSLYSPEHEKWLQTDYSTAKVEHDPQEKGRMRLTIDGIDVFGWLRKKHEEQYPRPQVKEPQRQNIHRGIKR